MEQANPVQSALENSVVSTMETSVEVLGSLFQSILGNAQQVQKQEESD